MRGSRVVNLVLLLGGVAAGLLASEATVRVFARRDHRTGYAPVDTRRRWGGPRNSRGYRDEERSQARTPGVRRAVALGDSFTWGVGVEFEDAWPQRVQRMLTRRRGERWEVVSLARPGMNSVEQARQLADEGFAYEPEVVILGYCLNDTEDENAAELRRARDWQEQRAARRRQREGRPLLERSALYQLLDARLRATRETRRRIVDYQQQYDAAYPGWKAGRAALVEMGARCRARRVPLLVVVFPLFGNPLDERYPFAGAHEKVLHAATEGGARVLDLLPAYRNVRPELLVVDGANDEHPNEIAHRIAANVILSALDDVLAPAHVAAADPKR